MFYTVLGFSFYGIIGRIVLTTKRKAFFPLLLITSPLLLLFSSLPQHMVISIFAGIARKLFKRSQWIVYDFFLGLGYAIVGVLSLVFSNLKALKISISSSYFCITFSSLVNLWFFELVFSISEYTTFQLHSWLFFNNYLFIV